MARAHLAPPADGPTNALNTALDTGLASGLDDGLELERKPSDDSAMRNTPWFAIAVAFHGLLLLLVWSLEIAEAREPERDHVANAIELVEIPEPPIVPPTPVHEVPEPLKPDDQPNPDPQLVEKAEDTRNTDPTEQPTESLKPAEIESPVPSPVPHPTPSLSPAVLGPGASAPTGGGGGPFGGDLPRRSSGEGSPPVARERVLAALRWLASQSSQASPSAGNGPAAGDTIARAA